MNKNITDKFEVETIVKHIDSFGRDLNEWEVDFIADLIDNPPKKYSEKQINIINRIYEEKC